MSGDAGGSASVDDVDSSTAGIGAREGDVGAAGNLGRIGGGSTRGPTVGAPITGS